VLALTTRPRWLSDQRVVLVGGIGLPLAILTALIAFAARTAIANEEPALRVRVTGEQWWWRVRYVAADGSADFETANEIHLPVGARVEFLLESADVLHSFWLPTLSGKVDMIPGRINRLVATPRAAGVMRGQCAEYCGGPHALMALVVVAETPDAFARWQAGQRVAATASHPMFEERCAGCHAIRGTPAQGARAPDLTHVGSRRTIAAGTLPADEASFARFIASSQHVKPGNLMPSFADLSGDELAALGRYLASLR
jgi:cytochrome c oxidase subunit 2